MKPTQEQLEDQLLDSLLHEQSRSDREQSLLNIENALDAGPVPISLPARSPWPRRLAAIAASIMVGCLLVLGAGEIEKSRKQSQQAAEASAAAETAKAHELDLVKLEKSIRNQEDKVAERGKVLATIVRTKDPRNALEAYDQLLREKLQLEGQINSLLKYDDDQLMLYAVGLDLPDNVIRNIHPSYLEAKRHLEDLKIKGLGEDHPTVKATVSQIATMKRQLDEGVVTLRATLQAKLDIAGESLKSVELAKNDTREEAIKRGLDAQDYVDAKRNFETDNQLLMQMKLNQVDQRIARNIEQGSQRGAGIVPEAPASKAGPDLAKNEASPSDKTILDQEGKVEERRKVLATIVRTKGIIYHGTDSYYGNSESNDALARDVPAKAASIAQNPKSKDKILSDNQHLRVPGEESGSNTERYGALVDPSWQRSSDYPLSTFSIDVDNASYSNIRRMIRDGQAIPRDAVRIEECINAFDYNYAKPDGDQAFAVHTTLATCPWAEQHLLLKVGIKGREISAQQRPVSNLVFLIDVSGSMQDASKLPLVKESLKLLLHQLDERDSVSFVVYAGSEGVVLPPTKMTESGRTQALEALGKLEAGGSTNGGSGIKRAYQIARGNFIKDGVNRVILATDGDFNVGITDTKQLVELVKERAAENIYLSVLAFGTGNLNDALLESISKDGNGNYYYIDSIREGRKVFLQRLSGTLITIAKDVKIQIEFNPRKVGSYRLIGYANRVLRDEDFNNDKVDAGDIGAGHTVTAFYEIVPSDMPQPNAGGTDPLKYQQPAEKPAAPAAEPSDEWLTLKLRHKSPEGDLSSLQETVVKGPAIRWQDSDGDFTFASAVAIFGMKLRGMDEVKNPSWSQIRELATPGLKEDRNENRAEFVGLLETLDKSGQR